MSCLVTNGAPDFVATAVRGDGSVDEGGIRGQGGRKEREIILLQARSFGQDQRPLQHILQLAYIPRPVVRLQHRQGPRRNGHSLL